MLHGLRGAVDRGDVEAAAQEIEEVPAAAAAGVEDFHPRKDPAFEELIEKVDVDLSEPFAEGVGGGQTQSWGVGHGAGV